MAHTLNVDTLFASGSGEVLLPGTEEYETARAIWNGAIDKKPAAIVKCRTAGEVAAAVRFAAESGVELSVRGGGHNYAGFALTDGGLTIDLSLMRVVAVDPVARRAVCGGGATWRDIDAACQEHGLAVPGGFISHTGVAGLSLGGGIGWLTRYAGLSSDNLVGAEVVTASGEVVRASVTENEELFWAIRGGGGNFGVVTTFEFTAHQIGQMVDLGLLFFGLDQGGEMLRLARELTRELPDEVTAFVGGLNAPPEAFVPEQYHFAPGYALLFAGIGGSPAHAEVLAKVRAALPPLFEMVTPIPYVNLQQMFDPAAPWGMYAYEKAVYLDELSDAAIDVVTTYVPRKTSPLSFVPIFCIGGAYGRMGEDATAFGGRRSIRWIVNISGHGMNPGELALEREWVREFWSALVPHATGVGSYVNFMNEYEEDRVRSAYGPEKYARLVEAKRRWDPDNLFHLNANIRP